MAEALEQMILPAVNRHLVDTGERAEQVISQLMVSMVREGQVAVDCEWGANAAHEGASLLQLATRGLVVLVDLLALPTTPAVHKLLADVADLAFASRHVVVLGFDGEANDLPHLRAAWRRRGLVFPARVTRYVDVRVACARAGGWEADYDELRGYGLADCAAKFLGRRLDKSPRDLDWRRRPLTEAAVAYAALDAYALLQLYDRPEVASAVERERELPGAAAPRAPAAARRAGGSVKRLLSEATCAKAARRGGKYAAEVLLGAVPPVGAFPEFFEDVLLAPPNATGAESTDRSLPVLERADRCAVVGNGGQLAEGKGYGATIDAADVVLRMNAAPTEGRWKAVAGSKMTIRLLNKYWAANYAASSKGKCGRRMHLQCPTVPGETLVLSRGVDAKMRERFVRGHFAPGGASGVAVRPLATRVIALGKQLLALQRELDACVNKRAVGGPAPTTPSSGLISTLIALSICRRVTLYGFGHGSKGLYQYYRGRLSGNTNAHDFGSERGVFYALRRSYRLTVCGEAANEGQRECGLRPTRADIVFARRAKRPGAPPAVKPARPPGEAEDVGEPESTYDKLYGATSGYIATLLSQHDIDA